MVRSRSGSGSSYKVESAPNSRAVFMQFVLQPRVVGNSVRGCTVTLANETTERSTLLTNS